MRFKVGITDEEISLENVRVLDKGPLKMAFMLVKYQPNGPKVSKYNDCKYFEVGDKKWFNLPQKEVHRQGVEKKDYYPVVVFDDREYMDQLKAAVVQAVDAYRKENHGTKQGASYGLQSQSPFSF